MSKISKIIIFIAALAISSAFLFFIFQAKPLIAPVINMQKENLKQLAPTVFLSKWQPPKSVSLIAVGDVMLSRNVAAKMKANGADYPFLNVKDFLKTGDIVFGNLETPITPGPMVNTPSMTFRADINSAPALKDAGFTILSLANNHTPNFGERGLLDTFKYLTDNGIQFVGAGNNTETANAPVYIAEEGMTFAFLAYNNEDVVPAYYEAGPKRPGTALMNVEKMKTAVKAAKENADFVIVSMHSGTEYANLPDEVQISFARAAIDAGAELVIGHHPHVIQSMEKYHDKYIFYSLGNFIFDQMFSMATREGLALKIDFNKDGVTNVKYYPALIYDYSQPKFLDEPAASAVLKKLNYSF